MLQTQRQSHLLKAIQLNSTEHKYLLLFWTHKEKVKLKRKCKQSSKRDLYQGEAGSCCSYGAWRMSTVSRAGFRGGDGERERERGDETRGRKYGIKKKIAVFS